MERIRCLPYPHPGTVPGTWYALRKLGMPDGFQVPGAVPGALTAHEVISGGTCHLATCQLRALGKLLHLGACHVV